MRIRGIASRDAIHQIRRRWVVEAARQLSTPSNLHGPQTPPVQNACCLVQVSETSLLIDVQDFFTLFVSSSKSAVNMGSASAHEAQLAADAVLEADRSLWLPNLMGKVAN